MIVRRALTLGCALSLVWSACSADRKANPEYGKKCDADAGFVEYDEFCIKGKPPKPIDDEDAGRDRDADAPEGGVDSGVDAGAPESCAEIGETAFCYPVPKGLESTATQDPCRVGTMTCTEEGVWSRCMGAVVPMEESCNDRDDDCDGITDEGQLGRVCRVQDVDGACAEDGIGRCNDGVEECFQTVDPVPETCNDVDDDCDGETDEGLEVACYPGDGAIPGCALNGNVFECVPASTCAPGKIRCVDGQMTDCTGAVVPADEAGTNVGDTPLDEDCDGTIDEEFPCQNGATFACYTGPLGTRGMSPCSDGTRVCDGAAFGECMGEITPGTETCSNQGVDDDCDGQTDNIPRRGTSCSDSSANMGSCKQDATWQCVAGAETCVDAPMEIEVCSGQNLDEDCDGRIDEGFDLQNDENNCGSCGQRCGAGQTCCNGACVSTVTSNAHCGGCNQACGGANATCCASACRNTRTDNAHCGMCNKPCLLGGLLNCSNGACL